MPKKDYYICNICFEDVDKVQGKTEGAALCYCMPRESMWLGAERGAMGLYEKVWSSREVS